MRIKNLSKTVSDFVQRLGDPRFAGQIVFVIIVLLISWSGIKSIQTNYKLQKQISELRQQNQVQKLKNQNLALQNNYLNSNQYLELSARQNFGLAAAGEKEVVVPTTVAMAYTVDLPSDKVETAVDQQPAYQRNFNSWINFFLNRSNDN